MAELTLHPMTEADHEATWSIHRDAFRDAVVRKLGRWDEEWLHEAWQSDISQGEVLEVRLDGALVGYVQLVRGEGDVFIKTMAVTCRGQGVGTTLLGMLKDMAAREGASLALSVYADNPAMALYERAGFVVLGQEGIRVRMRWTPPG